MKLTKNAIELFITGVLIIVLIAFLGINLRRCGRRLTSKPGPPTKEVLYPEEEEALMPLPKAPSESFLRKAVTKERERGWGRDPFILGSKKRGAKIGLPLDLRVTGIIFDEDRPQESYAIVSGELLRLGDEIAGAKVVDIKKGSVTLRKDEKELTLRLWEAE